MNNLTFRNISLKIVLILFTLPVFAQQQSALPLTAYGIWDRGDKFVKDPTNPIYSFYKGTQVELRWSDIQPTNSANIIWTAFDAEL